MADGDGANDLWRLPENDPNNISAPSPTGGGVMDFIKSLGIGSGGFESSRIPALLTAWNQYNDSGKYMDLATKYKDEMNPFGKERPYYQDRLHQLTEDPNAYLAKSPDYQAALRQGMGARERSQAASGYAGSGTGAADIQQYGGDLAAGYLDRDRQSLMKMAGADIGPGAAAHLIETGITNSVKSQDDALASLMWGLSNPSKNPPGSGGPGGPGGAVTDILRTVKPGDTAAANAAIQALVKRGWSMGDATAAIGASLRGEGGRYTQNGQPWSPTNPDGYHSETHPGQGGPEEGTTQPGDTFTDPETGQTWYNVDGEWIADPGSGPLDGGITQGDLGISGSNEDINYGGGNDNYWDF